MSVRHGLNDEEVDASIGKMVAFIIRDGKEKADEIRKKADEDYERTKANLIREGTARIDAEYEKKFKLASMSQQITKSTVANKSRLRILGARQELLEELFQEARDKLKDFSKNKEKYTETVKGLILEGFYAMNESKLQIRARKQDYDIVRKGIESAQKLYKDKTGKEVKADIDEANPLPEESFGGVSIIGGRGKIEINNTLEQRLKLLETDALPDIRAILFGENANRKFKD